MKRLFLIISIILLISANAFAQQRGVGVSVKNANGQTQQLYDGSYALIIGNSEYSNGWDRLSGVKADVVAVRGILERHGFKVETEENLTSERFEARIRKFINDYGFDRDNRLIIYYAEHGYTLPSAGDKRELGYIIPADTPLPDKDARGFRQKAVDMYAIQTFAKQIQAKHALFVFDSCFSGKLFTLRDTLKITPFILDKVDNPVRQFITAGNESQTVPDESIFRKAFVRGLEGDADRNNDTYITGTELADYLKEAVTNYSNRRQTPQYGLINDIDLDRGDFVFVVQNSSSARLEENNSIQTKPKIQPQPSPSIVNSNAVNKQSPSKADANSLTQNALTAFINLDGVAAEKFSNDALKINKNLPMALALNGWSNGRWSKKSRANLERAVQIEPQNIFFLALLSYLNDNDYRGDKQYRLDEKSAKELADKVLTLQAKTDLDYYGRGLARTVIASQAYGKSYDEKSVIHLESASEYGKSIELNPNFVAAYFMRGNQYEYAGKEIEAIADFTKIIEILPNKSFGYSGRGGVFWYFNCANKLSWNHDSYDVNSALSDLDKAITLSSDQPFYFNNRGDLYFYKEEYEKAISDYTKAIQLYPKWWGFYSDRAKAYEKIGRKDLAEADRKMVEKLR